MLSPLTTDTELNGWGFDGVLSHISPGGKMTDHEAKTVSWSWLGLHAGRPAAASVSHLWSGLIDRL